MKIGLALGLLLIGTVAALFFRNDPAAEEQTPQLKNSQAVSKQVSEKEGPKPYFNDSSLENVERKQVRDIVELDDIQFETEKSGYPFENTMPSQDKNPFHEAAQNRSTPRNNNSDWSRNRPPSPISEQKSHAGQNQAWEPVPGRTPKKQFTLQHSSHVHTVKRGETLSSLAVYYLGSESRFLEIYQLNKDVLKSPNALSIGMKLRIPPKNGSRSNSLKQNPARNVSSQRHRQPNPQPRQSGLPGFVPASRSPFAPGAYRQQNRTLTQQAPPRRSSGRVSYVNAQARRYTIQSGDSLERIAVRIYGDRRAVQMLVDANRNVISNPNAIRPGMVLVLPNR